MKLSDFITSPFRCHSMDTARCPSLSCIAFLYWAGATVLKVQCVSSCSIFSVMFLKKFSLSHFLCQRVSSSVWRIPSHQIFGAHSILWIRDQAALPDAVIIDVNVCVHCVLRNYSCSIFHFPNLFRYDVWLCGAAVHAMYVWTWFWTSCDRRTKLWHRRNGLRLYILVVIVGNCSLRYIFISFRVYRSVAFVMYVGYFRCCCCCRCWWWWWWSTLQRHCRCALDLIHADWSCSLFHSSLLVVVDVFVVSVFSPEPKNICKQNDYLCILGVLCAASYLEQIRFVGEGSSDRDIHFSLHIFSVYSFLSSTYFGVCVHVHEAFIAYVRSIIGLWTIPYVRYQMPSASLKTTSLDGKVVNAPSVLFEWTHRVFIQNKVKHCIFYQVLPARCLNNFTLCWVQVLIYKLNHNK